MRQTRPWTDRTEDGPPKGGDSVTIPRVDCSYVFFSLFMFHLFLPASPAVPVHDPSRRHVISHHMTDRLGHLPAACVNAHLVTIRLLYCHLRLHMDLYSYVSACLSLRIVIELDHR